MPDTVKMDVREFIRLAARKYGVPETFYSSIFDTESSWRPDIHDSPKGAMGIGQLMPATARRLGVNPRDPAQNIIGSLKLQRQLLDKYRAITEDEDKAWILAAAAYNAGEPAVEKFGGVPPYKETQNYVRKLIKHMRDARRSGGSPPKQPLTTSTATPSQNFSPPDIPEVFSKLPSSKGKLTWGNKPPVRPAETQPSPTTTSTATPSSGLTPPPKQGRVAEFIQGASKVAGRYTGLGVLDDDTRQSFFEGVARTVGSNLADFGWAFTNPYLHPLGYAAKRISGMTHPFQTGGEALELGAMQSIESHRASSTLGRFRQGMARGAGAAMIELPKFFAGAGVLKAATLPVFGGLTGGRHGGLEGAARGAAMGAVYHYGGQFTGQYLGKLSNTLIWIGAPAVEQHVVNGVPLDDAIAEGLPLGIFGGLGGNRVRVELPNGRFRNATLKDLPGILRGTTPVAEPQQVVMYGVAQRVGNRAREFLRSEEGSLRLPGEEGRRGKLTRLPKTILSDLATLGAFHYEAGTRKPDDWVGRMLTELGETPETVKPQVVKQLGEVYARSKTLYEEGTAPTFVSGLKQTVKELYAQKLIGDRVNPERLVNLIKSRGQAEELAISELEKFLTSRKATGEATTISDIFGFLDLRGMTMDVMRAGGSGRTYDQIDPDGPEMFLGMATRGEYLTPGGRDYFEGVVYSNKALEMSTDFVHFGFRPDQVSWYRGQLVGGEMQGVYRAQRRGAAFDWVVADYDGNIVEGIGPWRSRQEAEIAAKNYSKDPANLRPGTSIALLEEVQSKRAQKAREYGVTRDPDNAHSRLVSLERELSALDDETHRIEQELGMSRWEPADEYSRYTPEDEASSIIPEDRLAELRAADNPEYRMKVKELDKLRAKTALLEQEIHNLEYVTDTAPAPIAPHLDTWYDPALKGFLREAAERLEPDQQGNIYATWTPASGQLSRYPSTRKTVQAIKWSKDPDAPFWDITLEFQDAARAIRTQTKSALSREELKKMFGPILAEDITNNKATEYDFNGVHTLFPKGKMFLGGEWAVKLYGDTKERIANLYPNKPELQEYAWKESGNKATVPAWLEKYAKAWGGKIELKVAFDENIVVKDPFGFKVPAEVQEPRLVIPEAMRLAILKEGQLFFGRKLADLPKGIGYGLRNRITPEEAAQAARELIAKRHQTKQNLLTGERVPDPSTAEGGFLRMGSRKPALDPRVETDVDKRGRDTVGLEAFVRSPSRLMAGQKDPKVDGIAERIFDAEVREHDYTTAWGRRFNAILDSLNAATFATVTGTPAAYTVVGRTKPRKLLGRAADKAAQQKTFSDFIDLIEKPFEIDDGTGRMIPNPDRQSANPLIQRALQEHDSLAQDFKNYLLQSYADRGITIADPANWGITEKGYFRHLFPGEDNIFMNGDYQGTAGTYVDAIKMANDLITANPTATVEIRRRPVQFVDPSTRISTRAFERLVRETLGTLHADGYIHVSAREVRQDYVGLVGKKENIGKFFAAALKREGYTGYLRDYEQVMRAHYFQLARSQELSKLRKDITPTLEELRREGKRGIVESIERHLDDLWGKPLTYEKRVGGLIRRFPALRERIANPDLGLEIVVRKIASLHNILKLRYNPKAMFVNRIQPLRTLWPYLTNKDMLEVIKRYRDPKWRQDMTELGVMSGAVKLETGGSRVEGFGAREFIKDPFTYVSGSNRALGYTAGVIFAERSGITGYEAHKMGMKWAAKVEFDNSKWDAPQFLRHSAGQFFGQYKGFLVKDIENTIDIFSRQATDSPTHPGLSKASRIGKWFIGTATFGGARAALSPLPWLGTAFGYSMYLSAAALIQATTNTSEKDAKFYASIAFLGTPAAAGLDLSASLTPIDDPPGLNAWEKIGRFSLGPSVGSAYDITRAGKQLVDPGPSEKRPFSERLANFGTKVSPYVRMVERGYQLEQQLVHGKKQYFTVDQHRVRLTTPQLAFGAVGVPPANQTLYYEEKETTGKSPLSKSRRASPFGDPTRGLLPIKPFRPLPKRF